MNITVSINFMKIRMGGRGVFELGNPEGRGGSSSFGNVGGRGSQKTMPSIVGVWIISGITNSITC